MNFLQITIFLLLLIGGPVWGQTPVRPEAIYDQLIDYLELDRSVAPRLEVSRLASSRGAVYDATTNTICLEQHLVGKLTAQYSPAVCEAAIGWLLGHELGHFMQQAPCQAADLIHLPAHLPLPGEHKAMRIELEADYFGAFALHLAEIGHSDGIDTVVIDLLVRNNAHYLAEYPPGPVRRDMIRRAARRIDTLLQGYRLGVNLLLIEQYGPALTCFQKVDREFTSHKVLNNMAVCHLHLALARAQPGTFRFAYPFEIDPFSRLERGVREPLDPSPAAVDMHLHAAASHLRAALRLHPDYPAARVNLICQAIMSQQLSLADSLLLLRPQMRPAQAGYEAVYEVLAALLATARRQPERAGWHFDQAGAVATNALQRRLVEVNRLAARGISMPQPQPHGTPLLPSPDWHQAWQRAVPLLGQQVRQATDTQFRWLFWCQDIGFQQPADPDTPFLHAFPAHAPYADCAARLGTPTHAGYLSGYLYAVYWTHGLILWIDAAGRVDRWTRFLSR